MKTKALISFAVTAKLICVFVFAYAKSRFSHNEAQIIDGDHSIETETSYKLQREQQQNARIQPVFDMHLISIMK